MIESEFYHSQSSEAGGIKLDLHPNIITTSIDLENEFKDLTCGNLYTKSKQSPILSNKLIKNGNYKKLSFRKIIPSSFIQRQKRRSSSTNSFEISSNESLPNFSHVRDKNSIMNKNDIDEHTMIDEKLEIKKYIKSFASKRLSESSLMLNKASISMFPQTTDLLNGCLSFNSLSKQRNFVCVCKPSYLNHISFQSYNPDQSINDGSFSNYSDQNDLVKNNESYLVEKSNTLVKRLRSFVRRRKFSHSKLIYSNSKEISTNSGRVLSTQIDESPLDLKSKKCPTLKQKNYVYVHRHRSPKQIYHQLNNYCLSNNMEDEWIKVTKSVESLNRQVASTTNMSLENVYLKNNLNASYDFILRCDQSLELVSIDKI